MKAIRQELHSSEHVATEQKEDLAKKMLIEASQEKRADAQIAALKYQLGQNSQKAAAAQKEARSKEQYMEAVQQKTTEALQESQARAESFQDQFKKSERTTAGEKEALARIASLQQKLISNKATSQEAFQSSQDRVATLLQQLRTSQKANLEKEQQIPAHQQMNHKIEESVGEHTAQAAI